MAQAFHETFQLITPTDAIIVEMYDEYSDEPAENADFARRYGV